MTQTGGRSATTGVIPGHYALSVGKPDLPAPTGWRWVALSDLARLESGHTPSRSHPEYWDGDTPWIGIRDATSNDGRTIADTEQHTNELGIANSSARLLPAHTVCLSRTASIGYVVVMGTTMATSQDFVNWVCSEDLDWRFLKYILLLERDSLLRFAHGTTHQTIYFPEVKAFHICAPEIDEQRRIADVLCSFDDMIEQNRGSTDLLMRFVSTYLDAARVQRGASWLPRPITQLARFINGRAFTNAANGRGRPILRIRELNAGVDAGTLRSEVGAESDNLARSGDLLFSWSGSLGVYRWTGDEALINQHIFKVLPILPVWFVHDALARALPDFQAIARDKATTMGHIQRHHLEESLCAVPGDVELKQLDGVLAPMYHLAVSLEQENHVLRQLRDLTLPSLMSGRIRLQPTGQVSGTAA